MLESLPLVVLLVTLMLGIPIAFALAGAGLLGIYLFTGSWESVIGQLGTSLFTTASEYLLTTIPMFILMAYFASSSGLARDLFNGLSNWLSHIRGGLAIATVFSCGIFGAMSGASVAAASVMANIAMPNMRRLGYSEELAAGAIGVGATLDILIPPSVGMVIYGIATETSIGKLLVAGIIPGVVLGILLSLAIIIWVTISPSHAPQTFRVPWVERWRGLLPIWPTLVLIICVLGLLYSGIVTPTEVGAIGALMSAVIGLAMKRLTWAGMIEALRLTIRVTAMIFLIIFGAKIFGYYMTLSQVPQNLLTMVTEMQLNRWVVISGIVVGYFVISMFMDEIPLLLITLSLTFPLVMSLGFDPVWFGVLSILMVAMGLVFPPVGMVAFVVAATANVKLTKVYKGTSILVVALVATTILLMIFPQLALWLPSRMK
jgi:tripartite ATP-independent transporter DctM subunit